MNPSVEAKAVESGVSTHRKRADDPTGRKDLQDQEPNSSGMAKPEHDDHCALTLRAIEGQEWPGCLKMRNGAGSGGDATLRSE
jgi:hypothetical protein